MRRSSWWGGCNGVMIVFVSTFCGTTREWLLQAIADIGGGGDSRLSLTEGGLYDRRVGVVGNDFVRRHG